MVRGLARIREHFAGLEECFVIIGGSACDLWLQGRGLGFRRTRDIDLVLIAERLTPAFSGLCGAARVQSANRKTSGTHWRQRSVSRPEEGEGR